MVLFRHGDGTTDITYIDITRWQMGIRRCDSLRNRLSCRRVYYVLSHCIWLLRYRNAVFVPWQCILHRTERSIKRRNIETGGRGVARSRARRRKLIECWYRVSKRFGRRRTVRRGDCVCRIKCLRRWRCVPFEPHKLAAARRKYIAFCLVCDTRNIKRHRTAGRFDRAGCVWNCYKFTYI